MIKDKIVIVGAGTAGLMSATYIKTLLPNIKVIIYYDKNIKPLPVGESTQPYVKEFFNTVFGSNELSWNFFNDCNFTYKLYAKHENWNNDNHSWIYPFYHEELGKINSYSVESLEKNLFHFNDVNLPPKEFYAFHLESVKLQKSLLNKCEELDIEIYENHYNFKNIKNNEFVLDCRGFNSHSDRIQISPAIINDFAIAGHISINEKRHYTKTIAQDTGGWIWEIPLKNKLGIGRVFNKTFLPIEQAKKEMYIKYGIQNFFEIPLSSRYEKNPCDINKLKIGTSSVFIEPLEATTLVFVTFMIYSFVQHFNESKFNIDSEFCKLYNEGYRKMVDSQLIYIEGFYCLSDRKNNDYWKKVTSNYDWYMKKLETFGWPEYFGEYGFTKFFNAFNKFNEFKHIVR